MPTFDKEGALFFFFFFLFSFVAYGACGCHCQVLAKRELPPPFFRFFLLVLKFHCQVSVEREPKLPLFSFFFFAFAMPSSTLGKTGPCSLFFLWVASKTSSPRFGREGACSPFFIFFCCFWGTMAKSRQKGGLSSPSSSFFWFFFLLGTSGQHYQVSIEGKLHLSLFFLLSFFFGYL